MKKSLSSGRRVAGTQALCVWESKGLIMLSQEKQLANNNYWAASEFRAWNPASWNPHKRGETALPLQSLASPRRAARTLARGRQSPDARQQSESPGQARGPGSEALALSRRLWKSVI